MITFRRPLPEPARPGFIRRLGFAPWLAVAGVCIGAFMGQLDASIVSIALPAMSRDLHAGLGAVEWVVLAYIVVLAGGVAAAGRIADAVGRKAMYLAGFAVFVAGSAACAAAPSLGLLVGARLVQGAGAVLLQANSVALIRDTLSDAQLGTGIGVQGAAQAVGLAAGPALGGALVTAAGWRLVFLVNVPVGLAGLGLGWLLLPRSRNLEPGRSLDAAGTLTLAAAVAAALAALSLAVAPGASPGLVGGCVAAAAAFAALAALRQRARPGSVLDADLSRRPAFLRGSGAALLAYAVLFGLLLVMPFYLEATRGETPLRAGLELSVVPLALGLVAPAAGRLADRAGYRPPAALGLGLVVAGLILLAAAPQLGAFQLVALALVGAGEGLFVPANNAAVMAAVPRQRAGSAAGFLNMSRGLGTAGGVAVAGLVFGLVSAQAAGAAGAAPAAAATGAVRAVALVLVAAALWAGTLALRRA